jgi:hypothetical protein
LVDVVHQHDASTSLVHAQGLQQPRAHEQSPPITNTFDVTSAGLLPSLVAAPAADYSSTESMNVSGERFDSAWRKSE